MEGSSTNANSEPVIQEVQRVVSSSPSAGRVQTPNRRNSGHGTKESPFVVDWNEKDPENPYNWSRTKRWILTCQLALSTLCVSFGSSSYSGAIRAARHDLKMTAVVSILPISIYVFGFAVGPLIFAPLSEVYGRRIIFLCSFLPFFLFQIPCALAPNAIVLIVFRFLAGTFGSSPMANAGGVIADVWPANERGIATSIYSSGPWFGPIIGPIVGGYLVEKSSEWRWVFWIILMMAAVPSVMGMFWMPETYTPVLLRRRAKKLQAESGNTIYYISKYDVNRSETVLQKLSLNMRRPFVFIFTEPIVILLSIYIALLYGTLYAMFVIFPFVFQTKRHWGPGPGGLAFLGMGFGVVLGNFSAPFNNRIYQRMARRSPTGKASPELRMIPAMLGGVLVPIGLFWFAWTTPTSIHFIVPILAGVPFGMGMLLVFTAVVGYLMDTYQHFTASAIAASVLLRSILGASFPLITPGLFIKVGSEWGASIFAFLALVCMPLPFLFYFFGPRIRLNSRVARQFAVARMQAEKAAEDRSAREKNRPPSV